MTKTMADRKADQLRNGTFGLDPAVTFEVELEREGGRKYVVRQYRNGHRTGSVWYI